MDAVQFFNLEKQNKALIGTDAPELKGITSWINSKPLSLSSLKGKIVLLHFWTVGCSNCESAMPMMAKLNEELGTRKFKIIGIHSPEYHEYKDQSKVIKEMETFEISHPTAIDNDLETSRRALRSRN